jgi:ribonuclease Z
VEAIEGLRNFVRGAGVLVMEATFLRLDRSIARNYGHRTAAEAASLAAGCGAQRLILTHISEGYPAEEILAEAREIFPSPCIANDLEHFTV